MIGIVIISHGNLAAGFYSSLELFFGDEITQLEYCCLAAEDKPEDFSKELNNAIKKVDDGSGVIILADLFGGTPANRALYEISDSVKVVTGVNLAMLLELITLRISLESVADINIHSLMKAAEENIRFLNEEIMLSMNE